ncbi:MAG TPA: class I SAM-dependent methyltransferase [Mycobacteriales bacterium]|nr:class I SAM-dependent methyltransferase [Mycobacteriales bacterium]
MPTLPSQSRAEPHRHRSIAESFGVDPERYDRTRPPYPDGLISRILAEAPGSRILDVGCGTGIEARQLQAAGGAVLGVEPDARMADYARQQGTPVEVATVEDWDPAGRTFDAVVAGTAWHWVDPAAGAAKAGAVLDSGGLLAVFWHAFVPPPAVEDAFLEAYQRLVPDSPFRFQNRELSAVERSQPGVDRAAGGIRAAECFGAPEQWRFDWERVYSREEWLDQLPTQGTFTRLPAETAQEILDGVGAAIDRLGGRFTMQYATIAVAARRR